MAKVNLAALGNKLTTSWVPLEVSQVDDYHVLLVLYEGSYPPHYHNKDEYFLVLQGSVDIEIEGAGTVTLHEQESLVVRAGLHHRSTARTPKALVLLLEAKDITYSPVVMVGQVAEE
jgi:mannose-6-phosphate isomerase-like protein (cupin superfamily)